jgi:membrane fusion protein (multidrug efflux system)
MNDAAIDTAALNAEAEAAETRARQNQTRRTWLTRLGLIVLVAGLSYAAWYYLIGQNSVSTDNAYVNAEIAQITPLVAGAVIEVPVKDTQMVKAGDVLLRLDPANAAIAIAQAQADLSAARRKFRQAVAGNDALAAQVTSRTAMIAAAQAQLANARAEFDRAEVDARRRQRLAASGAVSGEELTSARRALAAARAALASAQAGIAQAESNRVSAQGELAASTAMTEGSTEATDPAVMAAMTRLQSAQLDMDRTTIRAPIAGIVTRRQVQLGQRVTQGQPVMSIVPTTQVYIDANFKERQLRNVRPGMPATVTADLYGSSVVYHGKVAGIGGGTGASMAMIPAQNATGNWIKVVQRLPVRIELDPKELAAHPLRLGLSTEVEIDITGN